jgi:hypothetical protein
MNEPTGSDTTEVCHTKELIYINFFLGRNLIKCASACWCSLLSQSVPNVAQVSAVCHARCRLLHLNKTCLHPFLTLFTTGPQPLPNRILQRAQSTAFSFILQYLVVSFRSSSRCLRLLPRFLVTSILTSISRFESQFLRST